MATLPVEVVSLCSVAPGRRMRLHSIDAGRDLQARLTSMGLRPGAEIEVVRNSGHGPLILEINGSRLMLGRGAVEKIRVI